MAGDKKYSYLVFYITTSGDEEARRIARALVETRYVACVSIIPNVRSFFWWQGKIDNAQEVLLIGKTEQAFAEKIKQKVVEMHSYEVPEIIFVPVNNGFEPYLKWIKDSLNI